MHIKDPVMKKYFAPAVACLALLSLPAVAADDAAADKMVAAQKPMAQDAPVTVEVRLKDAADKDAGIATLTEAPHGLLVRVEATGLSQGWHGLHFHGTGDCSDHAEHFKKSGGHAAREDEKHGLLSDEGPHAGDLPNLWAGADGKANGEFFTANIGFDMLRDADGGALMIHAGPDDHRTDPSGNSGDRVACGVIEPQKDE